MNEYKHSCGRVESAFNVSVSLDPRWAAAACRCGSAVPWELRPHSGEAERDGALERVDGGAPPDWKHVADKTLARLVLNLDEVTADDLWAALQAEGVGMPHEPRALGPVFLRAAKAGLIVRTSMVRESVRPATHRNPKRVWRSTRTGGLGWI
jgi:hypothetical protein